MKIEIGKYYVRRDGVTVGPAKKAGWRMKPFRVGGRPYSADGGIYRNGRPHNLDLVAVGDVANVQVRKSWADRLRRLRRG